MIAFVVGPPGIRPSFLPIFLLGKRRKPSKSIENMLLKEEECIGSRREAWAGKRSGREYYESCMERNDHNL